MKHSGQMYCIAVDPKPKRERERKINSCAPAQIEMHSSSIYIGNVITQSIGKMMHRHEE